VYAESCERSVDLDIVDPFWVEPAWHRADRM
jgi:hypothetical protein